MDCAKAGVGGHKTPPTLWRQKIVDCAFGDAVVAADPFGLERAIVYQRLDVGRRDLQIAGSLFQRHDGAPGAAPPIAQTRPAVLQYDGYLLSRRNAGHSL